MINEAINNSEVKHRKKVCVWNDQQSERIISAFVTKY